MNRAELNKLRVLLDRFNESQTPRGGNAAMFLAVRAIAQAGSPRDSPHHARSEDEFAQKMADNSARRGGDLGMQEPWRWLAAAAEGAERFEDHHLLASIAFFTFNWHNFLAPRMTEEDEYEMRLLMGAPPEPRVRIYRAAVRGLANADPEHVLIRDPKGGRGKPFTILQVAGSIAINIRKELADYPPDLQAFSRDFTP